MSQECYRNKKHATPPLPRYWFPKTIQKRNSTSMFQFLKGPKNLHDSIFPYFERYLGSTSLLLGTCLSLKKRRNGRTALDSRTRIKTLLPFALQRTNVDCSRLLRVRPSSGIDAERIRHSQRLEGKLWPSCPEADIWQATKHKDV